MSSCLYFDDTKLIRDCNNRVVGKLYIPASDIKYVERIERLPESSQIVIDCDKPRSVDQLRAQVEYLRTVKQPEQRSKEWYEMRETCLTASDLAGAIGESTYDKPADILAKKLGVGEPFTGNFATRWGQQYEPVACDIYATREQVTVMEFGLLPHPTIPFLGASPDGICLETGRLLEIKCPPKRVITGVVPRGYEIQMQLQMEVCDLDECDFEECKFEEYFTRNAFEIDNDKGNIMRTRSGLEKGVMVEVYDRLEESKSYRYCPVTASYTEAQKWLERQQRELSSDSRFAYRKDIWWKLVTYSCVKVKRDRVWFQNILPKISSFWGQVCYYKTVPIDVFYRDYNKTPRAVKVLEDEDDDPDETREKGNVSFWSESEDDAPATAITSRREYICRASTPHANVAYLSDSD